MTNALTPKTPFGAITLRGNAGMAQALANDAMDGARGMAPEGSQYLNFSGKMGVYQFGTNKEDLDDDELWLVKVDSFVAGWECWKDGSKKATRMASVYGNSPVPEPDFSEFGPFKQGDGWRRAKGFVVRSLDADDRQAYFSTSTKSAVGEVAALQQQIADSLIAGNADYWPVIKFKREKFLAQGSWNYKPVIEVEAWLTDEGQNALAEGADLDAAIAVGSASAPAALTAPEPAPAAAPAPEPVPAAAPAGRRRRSL